MKSYDDMSERLVGMKHRSAYIFALTVCMSVGCFSGCKKSPSEEKPRYTYTMTRYQTENVNPDAVQKKAIEDKYDINLDVWDVTWQKYDEIMDLKIASGKIPDIIYAKTTTSAQKYLEQGVAAYLDEQYLREKMPNFFARLDEEAPGIMKYYYVDGKLSALPSFSVPVSTSGVPMVWRGDWLTNVGIDKTPETLEEYEEAFYKFANNDPDGNGQKDTYGLSRSGMYAVFASYGYVPAICQSGTANFIWIEKDGKLVCSAVQPEMKQALEKLSKWYRDGIIDPEFIIGENKGGYWAISHQFVNGVIGFTCHGMSYHWEPMFYEGTDTIKSSQNRFELLQNDRQAADTLKISGIPPKNIAKADYGKSEYVKGERWMFSKELVADKQKFERLLEIYDDIYASKSNFDFANIGEKGVVWEYKEVPTILGDMYKMTDYIGDWKDEQYRIKNKFEFSLFKPSFAKEYDVESPRDKWNEQMGFGQNSHPVSKLYVTLPSETKYSSDLIKMEEDAYYSIIVGEKPIEYFDEFVSNWYKSGGDILEQEANEWYSGINNIKSDN